MVALEGVKRGCQADLSASTGKRKPAVAPGRAPEEQPRWFSWPQSTFHSLVSKDDAWARGRIFPKHGEKNPVQRRWPPGARADAAGHLCQ